MCIRDSNYAKEIKSMVEEIYGKNVRVFGAVIPHSVRAAETSAEGVSIFKHDPRGKAVSYTHLDVSKRQAFMSLSAIESTLGIQYSLMNKSE